MASANIGKFANVKSEKDCYKHRQRTKKITTKPTKQSNCLWIT